MAAAVTVPPNRAVLRFDPTGPARSRRPSTAAWNSGCKVTRNWSWSGGVSSSPSRRGLSTVLLAGYRADDSAPFEMSVENALKLLGVPEGASFDDILKAKRTIIASCKDDQQAIDQVEAAYDMLLMQSLSQRRAGKVENSNILYADVKPISAHGDNSVSQWLQVSTKNAFISIETPSTEDLGLQAGAYGILTVLCYANGAASPNSGVYAGADVPGLILATSFGATLYFMTRKNIKLGKATIISIGGLVAGAVVGSAVESWLQVDIVPILGIHSPATIVSEFILFSQLLVSLYLR
ncbi:protein CHAPERONE-LIKE PROTEIN OF POR1, chloroplastic-like [Impatiens glandulifera]|uniref:protein CHAPERONE-LIKE PROTEIN OF POR1, chloroplastic-like n=1 Tax=Impatiens glandulifera TaxID=253017 RepID=UPI001FB065BA|nr:protein CHAPERONE-LIKE PROTEIN OF POR1, chloroplastic-like [Impatiens glandulifera]